MVRRFGVVMLVLLILAGCGAADAGLTATPGQRTPVATAEQVGGGETPTAQPQSQAPLVVFTAEGGMKGARIFLAIEQDGTAQLAEEGFNKGDNQAGWTVPQQELEELKQLINSQEFAALEQEYLPKNTCCDRMTYTLTVSTASGEKTITTMDGVDRPPALGEVIDLLTQIQAAGLQEQR